MSLPCLFGCHSTGIFFCLCRCLSVCHSECSEEPASRSRSRGLWWAFFARLGGASAHPSRTSPDSTHSPESVKPPNGLSYAKTPINAGDILRKALLAHSLPSRPPTSQRVQSNCRRSVVGAERNNGSRQRRSALLSWQSFRVPAYRPKGHPCSQPRARDGECPPLAWQ